MPSARTIFRSITICLSAAILGAFLTLYNYRPYSPVTPAQAVAGTLSLDGSTSGSASFNGDVTGASFKDSVQGSTYYINPNGSISAILNGSVGIGVTNPGYMLSVEDSNSPSIQVADTTNGSGANNGLVMQMVDDKGYLKNYENDTLELGTNNQTKITIEPSGDVGIGNPSPSYPLDVSGTARTTGVMYLNSGFDITRIADTALQNNTTLASGILTNSGDGLRDAGGTVDALSGWWHVINMHHTDNNGYNAQIVVPLAGAGVDPYFRTSSAGTWTEWRKILAENTSGNVGIGTTSPGYILSVESSANPSIQVADTSSGSGASNGMVMQMVNSDGYLWNYETGLLQFGTNNAARMTISSTGFVSVARTSQGGSGTLSFEGNIGIGAAVDSGNTASAIINLKQGNVASNFGEWKLASRNTSGGEFGVFNTGSNTDAMTIYGNGSSSTQVAIRVNTQYSQRLCSNAADGSTNQMVRLGDCLSGGSDLAEMYGSHGDLKPGDVVSIDESTPVEHVLADNMITTSKAWVKKASDANHKGVIGIVSTNPGGEILGQNLFKSSEYPVAIALAGRVTLKVSTSAGPISVGDALTTSTIPGIAIKASKPGYIIAKALEPTTSNGTQMIEAFVYNSYFDPTADSYQSQIDALQSQINELKAIVNAKK